MTPKLAEISRFSISGLLVVAVDFISFLALHAAGLSRVEANALGMLTGFLAGFFLHKNLSFQYQGTTNIKLWLRYLSVFVFNLLLGSLLMFLSQKMGATPVIAKILVIAASALSSFLLSKLFVFKHT